MSLDSWTQKFDRALDSAAREIADLGGDLVTFINKLNLVEQGLIGGLGLLMFFYLCMPGGRGEGAGNPSGKYFAGILILFIATGVFSGLLMAGHITL